MLPHGTDRWFGFSVYVPKHTNLGRTHIFDTHAHNWGSTACSAGAGGSPLGLSLDGPNHKWNSTGGFYWWLHTNPPGMNGSSPKNGTLIKIDANGDLDRWVHWVFQINLDYATQAQGGKGKLRVWKDGKLVYENLTYSLSEYPLPASCGHFYPKIGAGAAVFELKSGNSYPLEVYYDELRWGDENSSFAEVDPTQSGPPNTQADAGLADGSVATPDSSVVPNSDAGPVHQSDASDAHGQDAEPDHTNTPDAANSLEGGAGCAIVGQHFSLAGIAALLLVLCAIRRRRGPLRKMD